MSQYRQATFIEGVRLLDPMTVGPVYVEPLPDVSLGRALVSELAAALERLGFVTPLDVPAVRASISAPRPVSVLLIGGQAESFVQMTRLFAANIRLVRDVLTLTCGGASRLLCQVLEHRTDDGEWLPLGVTNGGPGWQRSEIQALAPDGFVLAALDPTETYESLAQRPVVAFWVQLFTSAITEQRWDVRIFRLWSVLETIAKRIVPAGEHVTRPDGAPIIDHKGKPATTSSPVGRVYALLRQVHAVLALPHELVVCHPDHALWDEVAAWYAIRNAVAHDGAWRLAEPAGGGTPAQLRALAGIIRAARPGGSVEEGFDRYRQHLEANVEGVLRAGVLGLVDDALPETEPADEE